jgi:K+-sensing histidine kinase KdpD
MIVAAVFGWTIFLPWYGIAVPPIGNAFVPAYIIAIAYTITRHRLMNINILLRNILFHFCLAFLLYALFYGTAFTYKIIFGDVFAPGAYLIGLFLAPLLAIIFYSVSSFFSVFINKYFFPSIYSYQQAIKEASYSLSHHTGLGQIAHTLVNTIKKTVQPNGVAVLFTKNLGSDNSSLEVAQNSGLNTSDLSSIDYVIFAEYFQKNPNILTRESIEQLIQNTKDSNERKILHGVENQLHTHNIFVCVPLKNNFDLLGVIVIDNKQYENAYFQEDFDLLETLSHYAQIAVENSFLYKQIEKENSYLKKVSADKVPADKK